MPLSTTANYTQYGSVNVPGLSIDNPSSYAGQTLQLGIAPQATGRGRFTAERISTPNIRGGNAGIWYQELNFIQFTGSAEEINTMLGALTYHADPSGYSSDHVCSVTLSIWGGAILSSGTISFTHVPLYDNPPLNWTEALGVNRQYALFTPNTTAAFNLPAVGPNDATMLRMAIESRSVNTFYEVRGALDASLNPTPTIPANTVFSVNGTIVGTYSSITAMQSGLISATGPGQPLSRYRVQPRRRNSDGFVVGLRLEYLDRLEANQISVPSSASFSHGTMFGARAQIVRDSSANHPFGTIVRMIEESNQSTEWDGRMTFYAPRSAINTALFRTRWQPRSFNGVAQFQVSVTDGKGNLVFNDLYRYASLGSLLNRSQSMTLLEDGPAVDLNPSTPWWIVGPSFGTGFARYTAELRQSDRFASTINAKRSAGVDYGSATVQWIPPSQSALSNQVGRVEISNGTRGRRGGFRWRVGDTAQLVGGTGTQATVRIDQIVAPFQIPYQTMTTYITAAGSGYAVNDIVTLDGGTTTLPHRMRVTSVNGSGGVTGLVEEGAGGGNYTVLPTLNTALTTTRQTGAGTGLTITLPSNMPLAGSASVVSVLGLGNYTVNPTLADNEVTPLSGAAGFWLQLNVTMGTADPGGYLRIEGVRDEVNNILGDLSIILAPDYVSPFTITNTVTSNLGLNTSGTMACTVVQTADRTILSNGNITHNWTEDQTYTFNPPMFVSDNDPDILTFTASLTAAAGTLTSAGGGSFNAATRVWTASGLQASLNTIIAGLRFAPNLNYDTSFSIVVRAGDAWGTLAMTVMPVADATVVTNPGTYIYNPQSKSYLAGPAITVSDVDTGDVITLTATPSTTGAGLLNSDGSGWTRLGTNGLRIVGSASTVNTVLSSLNWTANAIGTNNLSGSSNRTWTEDVRHAMPNFVSVAGAGFDTTSFNLAVLATSNAGENTPRTIALRPDPVYVAGNIQLVLTMPIAAGALELAAVSGTARTAESSGTTLRTYTITGVDRDVNDILATATFVPAINFDQNFTIGAVLSGSTLNIAMTCAEVDDPTVISLSAAGTYGRGLVTSVVSPIVLSDPDTTRTGFASVTPNAGAGSVSAISGGVASIANGGILLATLSIESINSVLSGLRFTPTRLTSEGVAMPASTSFTEDTPLDLTMIAFNSNTFYSLPATLTVSAGRNSSSQPISQASMVLTYVGSPPPPIQAQISIPANVGNLSFGNQVVWSESLISTNRVYRATATSELLTASIRAGRYTSVPDYDLSFPLVASGVGEGTFSSTMTVSAIAQNDPLRITPTVIDMMGSMTNGWLNAGLILSEPDTASGTYQIRVYGTDTPMSYASLSAAVLTEPQAGGFTVETQLRGTISAIQTALSNLRFGYGRAQGFPFVSLTATPLIPKSGTQVYDTITSPFSIISDGALDRWREVYFDDLGEISPSLRLFSVMQLRPVGATLSLVITAPNGVILSGASQSNAVDFDRTEWVYDTPANLDASASLDYQSPPITWSGTLPATDAFITARMFFRRGEVRRSLGAGISFNLGTTP